MARNTADDFRPASDDRGLALWDCVRTEPVRPPLARASDPPTSHEAAAGAARFASGHHRQILDALVDGPASKTQLARRTGIDGVAVARRISELLDHGKVVVVSNDGVSPTGKRERVYALKGQSW